jgi:hypothetical protein
VFTKKVTLPLPPAPVPDPLNTLIGEMNVIVTGGCPDTATYTINSTRTGD